MLRFFVPVFAIIAASLFAVWPSFALEGDTGKIEKISKQVRVQIAELDQQLQAYLSDALEQFGDRPIECGGNIDKKSLSDCMREDYGDLAQPALSIVRNNKADDNPMDELAATEERFAMFNERLNKINDLLSRAGAKLYRTSFDITPEMDQLRRQVIVYVERKQEYNLRLKQAMLIGAVAVALIFIFALIFLLLRRVRAN
ncbi:hypothetical protein [Thalassospira alkalitolerans]|uniref:Uncharacterized protein n=1 Tax=Thalassospira alkalitolerans TaxID=1293890 RepID=A0A1Y2L9P7_9PROT|nr:hypothetical protein [Thalassospira alkalitolerans]OSQ44301.1 hypothetical protein TALK_19365 [Thalassospira alkalitolerans]